MGVKKNLQTGDSWIRGLYILLFGLLYSIAEIVLWAIVLFQFGSQLITARPNERLLAFTQGLNTYIYLILQYITYRSDDKPYPFDEWPGNRPCEAEAPPAARQGTPGEKDIDDEGETETGV